MTLNYYPLNEWLAFSLIISAAVLDTVSLLKKNTAYDMWMVSSNYMNVFFLIHIKNLSETVHIHRISSWSYPKGLGMYLNIPQSKTFVLDDIYINWRSWARIGKYSIHLPSRVFQILKDDNVKVLHSICQQI